MQLTCIWSSVTDHSSIITMATITHSTMRAVSQLCLAAVAGHTAIVDLSSASTKVG